MASVVSPLLLGASFGVLTAGDVRVSPGGLVSLTDRAPWLAPYPIVCSFLALSTCAYLAAVYLMVETSGELREDFRRRAIVSGTVTAALAMLALWIAHGQARWFFQQLFSARAWPVLAVGGVCFAGSAVAVFGRRYRLARIFAAAQTILMLLGWGLAHHDFLIYPDVTLLRAHGAVETIRFTLWSLLGGLALIIPAMAWLLRVFK